jgi:hypothetical protein
MCSSTRLVLLLGVSLAIGACEHDLELDGVDAGDVERDASVPPIAKAGPDQAVEVGALVALDGSGSESTGLLRYAWTVTAPTGEEVQISGAYAATSTFTAAVEGVYVATLVVTTNGIDSAPSSAAVIAVDPLPDDGPQLPYALLDYAIVDAEYSRSLDRLVVVSESPDRLHVHDPVTGDQSIVELPSAPTSVSVSPDGTTAAVGHNRSVSHVRLGDATLLANHPVSIDVFDIVHGGNGFAYAMAGDVARMRCVDLATGTATLHTGDFFNGGNVAVLHSSGNSIYTTSSSGSPDIHKFDISGGTAAWLYGRIPENANVCGELWMSQDGLRLFTRCRDVLRASVVPEDDIIHELQLELDGVTAVHSIDHATAAGAVALISDVDILDILDDTMVRIYGDESMAFERAIQLPSLVVADHTFIARGRQVFISADGTRLVVIVRFEGRSGLLDVHGIIGLGL